MDISIFLAKALGIYLIVLSFGMLMNRDKVMPALMGFLNNPGVLLFLGIPALILGTLSVISHNLWVEDWRVLITILGWSSLAKGITVVIFPELLIKLSKRWLKSQKAYYITYSMTFAVGLYLGYIGFF